MNINDILPYFLQLNNTEHSTLWKAPKNAKSLVVTVDDGGLNYIVQMVVFNKHTKKYGLYDANPFRSTPYVSETDDFRCKIFKQLE